MTFKHVPKSLYVAQQEAFFSGNSIMSESILINSTVRRWECNHVSLAFDSADENCIMQLVENSRVGFSW